MENLWSYGKISKGVTSYGYEGCKCGIYGDKEAIDLVGKTKDLVRDVFKEMKNNVKQPAHNTVHIGKVRVEIVVDDDGDPFIGFCQERKAERYLLYKDGVMYINKAQGNNTLTTYMMTNILGYMKFLNENKMFLQKEVDNFCKNYCDISAGGKDVRKLFDRQFKVLQKPLDKVIEGMQSLRVYLMHLF